MLRIKLIPEPRVVSVYQTINEYEAHIYKMALENEGVEVVLLNKKDSSYNAFGYIYLNVLKENEEKAKEILSKLKKEE